MTRMYYLSPIGFVVFLVLEIFYLLQSCHIGYICAMAIQIGEHDTVSDVPGRMARSVSLPAELRRRGASPPCGARVCVGGLVQPKDMVNGLPKSLGRYQFLEHASELERRSKLLFEHAAQTLGLSRAMLVYVTERHQM